MKTKKTKAGRRSKYREEYAKEAYNQALLGKTDAQLATFFEVAESTLNEWKKKHPEFAKQVRLGKDIADGKVANALHRRATGYRYDEKHYEDGELKKVIEKEVPPDPGAALNWLKNRQPKNWKDKVEVDQTITEVKKVFKIGDQEIEF